MLLCARYPVDYGLPGRVQVNPLSTLEEEEDDYALHPTVQALDVLQHRGNTTSDFYDYTLHPSVQALDVLQHRVNTTSVFYDYTLHPTVQALDVLQHRGNTTTPSTPPYRP
jgi:hypothetical protein